MLMNMLILLVIIVLTAGAAWLTWRAARAERLWVRVVGGLVAGLVTLLLGAIAFFGGRGVAAAYFPGAPAAPVLTVAGTPEQIARGDYLVNLTCIGCHSSLDAAGNPSQQHPLNGGWNIAQAEGFGFVGDLVTENLTPGGKLAGYSDGELFRALRYGVNRDGDLLAFMSLLPVTELSDADTEAIIAYLRTLPPAEQTATTGDRLSFVGGVMFGAGMFGEPAAGVASISAPAAGATAEYGRYVATFAECRGCHGPDVTGTPASALGPAVPNPRPLVGELTEAEFVAMFRSGIKPDGQPFPEAMPWQIAAALSDDDLAALYAYLVAPVP